MPEPATRPVAGAALIWNRIETAAIGLLGALALVAGVVQVAGRYLSPEHAISWAEEAIAYLIIWAVMIVSGQLVRTDGHVRPDLVLRLLPPGGQRVAELLNCAVALVFCAGLVWYGYQIVDLAHLLDQRSSTDLQFPMWIYYLSLPVGGGLMFVRYAIRFARYAFAYDPASMMIGHGISHEVPDSLLTPPVD